MAYETRDNSGTLGRNDRATTDKHPSHKGKARISGVDYWVSAWVKEAGPNSKAPGSKFFSLSFEPCETPDIQFGNDGTKPAQGAPAGTRVGEGQVGAQQGPSRGSQGAYHADDDDSIPF
jgi:hypothetical protein